MIEKIEKFITTLETTPMSVAEWLSGMAGIVMIRIFLEAFSNPDVHRSFLDSSLPTLIHCVFAYIGIGVVTVVVVSAVTRVSALPMMRSMIFLMPIMWLGPIIDLSIGGARIAYVFASPAVLLKDFLTFFGPLAGSGATLGLRVEFVFIVLLLGVYVYVHTRRWLPTILGMISGYALVFATMTLPSLLTPSNAINIVWGRFGILGNSLISHDAFHPLYAMYQAVDYQSFDLFFDVAQAQAWYLILCVAGVIWLYQVRKDVARAMFRNIRPERLSHFFIAGLLGGLIALAEGSIINWTILDFITIAVALFTITFAWTFAVVVNDLVDESIDAISNKERPLITGALSPRIMRDAAFVCGVMSLMGALALGSYATFWILFFSATYYIYSAPPLRVKRVPILASAFIGISTLAIMLLGFFLISANQMLAAFPAPIALLVILFMTTVTNVRDLKDIKGDAAAGIWTLPTLLGDSRSRMVIGAMMFAAYILVPIFIPITVLWIPSLLAGAVSWIGLVRGRGERFVFPIYFLFLASTVLLLYFS